MVDHVPPANQPNVSTQDKPNELAHTTVHVHAQPPDPVRQPSDTKLPPRIRVQIDEYLKQTRKEWGTIIVGVVSALTLVAGFSLHSLISALVEAKAEPAVKLVVKSLQDELKVAKDEADRLKKEMDVVAAEMRSATGKASNAFAVAEAETARAMKLATALTGDSERTSKMLLELGLLAAAINDKHREVREAVMTMIVDSIVKDGKLVQTMDDRIMAGFKQMIFGDLQAMQQLIDITDQVLVELDRVAATDSKDNNAVNAISKRAAGLRNALTNLRAAVVSVSNRSDQADEKLKGKSLHFNIQTGKWELLEIK